MKRFFIAVLATVMAVLFCACGCTNSANNMTDPVTEPNVTIPDVTIPSTNIPDPTVNSNSTMSTEGTEEFVGDTTAETTAP